MPVFAHQILGTNRTVTYVKEHSIVDPEEKKMELCSTNVSDVAYQWRQLASLHSRISVYILTLQTLQLKLRFFHCMYKSSLCAS